ncbi:BZ3500_MvSof-1268-A1-R1_C076g00394 [Microbotryum saponariae]|uniref:BZ3500_MvSof-1268-A1-R1_C076g00394 protein n=1 Tax=Microbotryum saponariae TaxID=289078 RepID=A0A2X0LAZ7_9BASI|nr:BZ3500_MvSof-1268-A1-R1_C076g00394 [Microbotryum saponariae]
MVPSCLDSFRLTFTDEQRNRRDLPELTTLTDRIRIQLRSAGLSTSHSAMLATSSPCPACRAPGHRLRDCTSRAKHPPTGPCRRCHKKGHWALDCKNRGEQARSSDDTQDDTSSSAASQPNVGYSPPASSLVANSQLTPFSGERLIAGMTTTPPLATGANPPIPAEQLAALTSLLSGLTAAASGTATPATTSGTTRTAFPKHARLDGAKTFANWTRQLRLCLADDIRSYVLDGIAPDDWTPSQRSARDAVAREVLANSIDSAEVSAVLDKIPTADLTAPTIYSTLKSRYP